MAKKDLGVKPYLFPMPVLMIATYCEDGSVDVMNMAWGGICGNNKVALNITESHNTSKKIILKKLNFPIEKISLNEFSIDNFINLKENTLYLFCKNN